MENLKEREAEAACGTGTGAQSREGAFLFTVAAFLL